MTRSPYACPCSDCEAARADGHIVPAFLVHAHARIDAKRRRRQRRLDALAFALFCLALAAAGMWLVFGAPEVVP